MTVQNTKLRGVLHFINVSLLFMKIEGGETETAK